MNPVVVLTDVMKSGGKSRVSNPPSETPVFVNGSTKKSNKVRNGVNKNTSNLSSRLFRNGEKRKRESWESTDEFEIEKIVGYHRGRRNEMWYLVKWKNWSSEHNTFEQIGNLTKCNFILMKFFEFEIPSPQKLEKKNAEVLEALKSESIYRRFSMNAFGVDDLKSLVHECPYCENLFEETDLTKIEGRIEKEYEYILRCMIGMCAHQDPGLFLRAEIYKLILLIIKRRRKQLQRLATIEQSINSLEKTIIRIENKIDLEDFPDINYIIDLKHHDRMSTVIDEALLGCECSEGCGIKSKCCGKMNDSLFAYTSVGKLRSLERIPIYECNTRCSCPSTCPNRVVQRGRQVKLCIFKTKSCGWGVKALERIPKGTFVCEYLGEVIPDSIAVARDVDYNHKSTYIFDMDFFVDLELEMFCIDAKTHGNVSRFINHSCDPNLVVYPVWVNGLAPNLHRLAFFANRNIEKGEEIQFDYENRHDEPVKTGNEPKSSGLRMISDVRCQCNAPNCRQWIYGHK